MKRIQAFGFAIALTGLIFGSSLAAGPVLYEPFDMTPGVLNGQPGGTGLGTWSPNGGGLVSAGTMSYGSLPTSGNKYTGDPDSGGASYTASWSNFGTTLGDAGLIDHGGELWFSTVIQPGSGSNDYGFVGISSETGNLGANFTSVPAGANVAGIWLQNGSDLEIVNAVNGTPDSRNRVQNNLSLNDPTFVVGKFTWGADGASNDLLEIFLPATDLVLPGAADSSTFVIDQASFDELGVWMRNANSQVDEIRFGATYDNVISPVSPVSPVPEPSSFALAALGLLGMACLGRRKRR